MSIINQDMEGVIYKSYEKGDSELYSMETEAIMFDTPIESPWINRSPLTFPYFKYPKNYVYNLLDYNKWKNFTWGLVLNHLLGPSFGEARHKSKQWLNLYACFCALPNQKVHEEDVKYIYECLFEMPSYAIKTLLEILNDIVSLEQTQLYNPYHNVFGLYGNHPAQLTQILQLNRNLTIVEIPNRIASTTPNCNKGGRPRTRSQPSEDSAEDLFKRPRQLRKIAPKIEKPAVQQSQPVNLSHETTAKDIEQTHQTASAIESTSSFCFPNANRGISNCKFSIIPSHKRSRSSSQSDTLTNNNCFAARANLSNFELNEMGDIVLIDNRNDNSKH